MSRVEKDSTHAHRTVGRVCDARVVFGVFHDNQAARAVQQQLGVEAQPMWLSRRQGPEQGPRLGPRLQWWQTCGKRGAYSNSVCQATDPGGASLGGASSGGARSEGNVVNIDSLAR